MHAHTSIAMCLGGCDSPAEQCNVGGLAGRAQYCTTGVYRIEKFRDFFEKNLCT